VQCHDDGAFGESKPLAHECTGEGAMLAGLRCHDDVLNIDGLAAYDDNDLKVTQATG
jgi:hypothetical protein